MLGVPAVTPVASRPVHVLIGELPPLDRVIRLGDEILARVHLAPSPGDLLVGDFTVPPARHAAAPLIRADLARGLVVLSTLPNISKHACIAQITEIDEHAPAALPGVRIAHVSADEAHHWGEVDRFHGNVTAPGYSLCCADPASRAAFGRAFGVAVEGHRRVAHGLFALRDGVFLAAEIPFDQMAPPDVGTFLARVRRLAGLG